MTNVILAIAPPYALFSPGAGLPDVPRYGVSVTPSQEQAIRAAAGTTGLDASYLIILSDFGTQPTEPSIYVTQEYVDAQMARTLLVAAYDTVIPARPDTPGLALWDGGADPGNTANSGDFWVH